MKPKINTKWDSLQTSTIHLRGQKFAPNQTHYNKGRIQATVSETKSVTTVWVPFQQKDTLPHLPPVCSHAFFLCLHIFSSIHNNRGSAEKRHQMLFLKPAGDSGKYKCII